MSKGLEALKEIDKFIEKNLSKTKDNESFNLGFDIGIIENELKDYEDCKKELEKSVYKQNTINDFYNDTNEMIDDLFNLSCTKLDDFLKEGKLYDKTCIMEIYCSVVRYIKTFTSGNDFNSIH